MYKNNKGYIYEKIAKKYLIDRQYEILDENFISRFGEIDIVAKKNNIICFIEVKGRKDTSNGEPRESVTISKIKKIVSTAKYYLLINNLDDVYCQFDVVEIIWNDKKINLIENAFEEM